MLRFVPLLAIALLAGPIVLGLAGALLPSLGLLPAVGGEVPTLEPWRRLAAQPGIERSVLISIFAGLLSALLSLVIVFLFLAGTAGTRLYAAVRRVVSPLLSVPHAAAAFGLAFLISPSGLFVRWLSPSLTGWDRPPDALIVHDPWGLAMIGGLVIKEVPFLLLMSLAVLPQVQPVLRLEVARSLGYRPVAAWLKAVAPSLYPLIRLPIFAVIAFASSTVEVAIILGPSNPPTLAVAVLRWFNDPDLSMRFVASAGAILQLGATLTALALWWLAEYLVIGCSRRWLEGGHRRFADRILTALGAGGMVLAAATAAVGIAGLALNSLAGFWRFPDALPGSFTLRHWQRILPDLVDPLLATLTIGALATACSLLLVLGALENEVRSGRPAGQTAMRILYMPLIVPQVAFLFGLVIGAEFAGLRPTLWLVALGHTIFVLPYVYLSLSEAYRRLDPRWAMVARTLGAGHSETFWRVRLPLLLAPCLTAAAVGLAVSVGLYLPTQLLGAGRVPTVTTEAVALASGGDRRVIGVWALVQAILPALGFALALGLPRLVFRNRQAMRGGTA